MNEYYDIDMIVDVVLIVFLEPNWKAVLVFREVYVVVICYGRGFLCLATPGTQNQDKKQLTAVT